MLHQGNEFVRFTWAEGSGRYDLVPEALKQVQPSTRPPACTTPFQHTTFELNVLQSTCSERATQSATVVEIEAGSNEDVEKSGPSPFK